jgi:hypothetical protein
VSKLVVRDTHSFAELFGIYDAKYLASVISAAADREAQNAEVGIVYATPCCIITLSYF